MLLYKQITSLNKTKLKKMLTTLLKEDVPTKDYTTQTVILKNEKGQYVFRSREKMVFCGAPIIENAFSKKVEIKQIIKDGDHIPADTDIAQIQGNVLEILTKERLILNMIQHLSGISSNTAKYVSKLQSSNIKILDTRKTTPGLRLLEKYAVNKGGGHNHRLDLSSGIMVKDNHIIYNIDDIVIKLQKLKKKIPIQVEIDKISQITKTTTSLVDAFLLDNMSPPHIEKCIEKINILKSHNQNIFIEVSGGINLNNISKYNIKGVNGISIGALTHQSTSVDIGLDKNN